MDKSKQLEQILRARQIADKKKKKNKRVESKINRWNLNFLTFFNKICLHNLFYFLLKNSLIRVGIMAD